MLLGTTANNDNFPGTESLIILLILQQRYAEAYELLLNQPQIPTARLHNMALCLHWNGNYQEALTWLESIQLIHNLSSGKPLNTNISVSVLFTNAFWQDYNTMRSRGVFFVRLPKQEDYGIVTVFEDYMETCGI
jgi:hypothetical protein